MVCRVVRLPNGITALVKIATPCRRRCSQCRELVSNAQLRLCDGKECDLPLCLKCTFSPSAGVDYCPVHAEGYKAAKGYY